MSVRPKLARRTRARAVKVGFEPGSAGTAEREARVAVAAYFIAQNRGFGPGQELDDWLAAEAEIARSTQLPAPVAPIQLTPTRSGL